MLVWVIVTSLLNSQCTKDSASFSPLFRMPIPCPPGSSGPLYFWFSFQCWYSKACCRDWNLSLQICEPFSALVFIWKEKNCPCQRVDGEKNILGIKQISTVRYDLGVLGTLIFPSLLLAIMLIFLNIFISSFFFFLHWENITNAIFSRVNSTL